MSACTRKPTSRTNCKFYHRPTVCISEAGNGSFVACRLCATKYSWLCAFCIKWWIAQRRLNTLHTHFNWSSSLDLFSFCFVVFKFICSFRVIVDRIDENKDEFVDMSELKNWISFTQRRYIEDDVNRQWRQHNPENAEKLHWEVSGFFFLLRFLVQFFFSQNWVQCVKHEPAIGVTSSVQFWHLCAISGYPVIHSDQW